MEQAKLNIGAVAIAVIITAILVGGGVYMWQNKQPQEGKEMTQQKDEKPIAIVKKDTQQGSFIEQLPLVCPPTGEIVKSKLGLNYRGRSTIELYLDCGDLGGFSSIHVFFAQRTTSENRKKVLYYSIDNQELEWQFGNNDVQTLAAKPDIPWGKLGSIGENNPVKILDLTLNGNELKVLNKPIEYENGGFGGFQDAKFVLTNLSEGTLTLDGKKFIINLEKNTVQELNINEDIVTWQIYKSELRPA